MVVSEYCCTYLFSFRLFFKKSISLAFFTRIAKRKRKSSRDRPVNHCEKQRFSCPMDLKASGLGGP